LTLAAFLALITLLVLFPVMLCASAMGAYNSLFIPVFLKLGSATGFVRIL
jgi:hypothetical protein